MLVNLPSKLTKHLLSRSSPCGQGLKAFPKPPTSHSLTLLGSLPRTLNQKIISKVILGGGQLSLFAWHCGISWDSRHSGLTPGKSPANLDEMVSYFLCTLGTRKTWDLVEKQTFFSIFSYHLSGSTMGQARSFFPCFFSFNPHNQIGLAS